MSRQKRWSLWFVVIVSLIFGVGTAVAQPEDELTLSLSRDFGTGLATGIQGTFSFRVSGPDNLAKVSFYIDEQLVGEDSEAPFRLQFKTGSFADGMHTLYATGITQDGRELTSNSISRNFLSSSEANRSVLTIVVPILAISLGGILVSMWIANRSAKASGGSVGNVNGPFGGTICPKCGKPFARHIWGLNMVVGKYDRCPHCGKWSLVRAMHPDVLNAAVEALQEAEAAQNPSQHDDLDNENRWQKRLDDSRFDG